MNEYSGAAARPFLLQAQEGGYRDPSVSYLLAVIALEQGDHDRADALERQLEQPTTQEALSFEERLALLVDAGVRVATVEELLRTCGKKLVRNVAPIIRGGPKNVLKLLSWNTELKISEFT